jgi:exopolysaccharide biosynthesis polyprenyl glycosylphosphotransferase
LSGELWILLQVFACSAGTALLVRVAVQPPVDVAVTPLALIGIGGTWSSRVVTRLTLRRLRRRGVNTRTYLFVGRGKSARTMAGNIQSHADYGIRIEGGLTFTGEENLPPIAGVPSLGSTAELQEILRKKAIDGVLICPSDGVWATEVKSLLRFCETVGLSCRVAPDFLGIPLDRSTIDHVGGVPAYTVLSGFQRTHVLWVKRAIDLVGATLGIVVLAPIMLCTFLAIKLTSRGPALFRQTRVGVNGRLFTLFKFRSMVQNAEQLRAGLEERNEQNGPVFKIKNDPRVTPVGRFLRKYSLDELPQLFNVLRGDMSLVGPRPPIPSEVLQYDWWQRRRLSVRPGITCIWQVSGRNSIGFDRWMELDLQYIDGWTLGMDMKIMAKTVKEVFRGSGA